MAGLQDYWNRLSPQARTAVAVAGAGGVALVVIRGRSSAPAPEPAAIDEPTTGPSTDLLPIGTTDAIGVDQLADFESSIATGLAELSDAISTLIDKPQGTSTTSTGRAIKRDTIRAGESADKAAIRVRKTTPRTTDGRPLTGAYIVNINRWKGTTSTVRPTGTPFIY